LDGPSEKVKQTPGKQNVRTGEWRAFLRASQKAFPLAVTVRA